MPIRLIAKELYRLQREVERLEKELQSAPPQKHDAIKEKLRKARAEWQQMRNILDGEKAPPPFRQPLSTFKRKS